MAPITNPAVQAKVTHFQAPPPPYDLPYQTPHQPEISIPYTTPHSEGAFITLAEHERRLRKMEEMMKSIQGQGQYGGVGYKDLCLFSSVSRPPKFRMPEFESTAALATRRPPPSLHREDGGVH